MNLLPSFDRKLVESLLLSGYSLDSPGLMYGKAGMSLCLFEAARFFNDESIEAHAFELFQEALAWDLKDYSFVSGKSGIAWTLLYLIENRFIDADYIELYDIEHRFIIEHLKEVNVGQLDIESSLGFLVFLFAVQTKIGASEFDVIQRTLLTSIVDYFSIIPRTPMERDYFYSNSLKLLGLYNENEKTRPVLFKIVSHIIDAYKTISEDCYICNNLMFVFNLFIYGVNSGSRDIVLLAESAMDIIFLNTIKEILSLKQIVDLLYLTERLTLVDESTYYYCSISQLVDSILTDEDMLKIDSLSHKMRQKTLFSLSEGIPRLMWVRCADSIKQWNPENKIIMLF